MKLRIVIVVLIGLAVSAVGFAAHSHFQLDSEAWTAIATVVLALVTASLVGTGLFQIRDFRAENKKWRTLEACSRYDVDPIIDLASRNVRSGRLSQDLAAHPENYKVDIVTILNYLDGIAIGIEQGLYIEELAKDHLNPIVQDHTKKFLADKQFARKSGYDPDNFSHLLELKERWNKPKIAYSDKGRS